MRVGNVAVIVQQGREKESGYVHISHGQKYALTLQSYWNNRRCDAQVTIDGKDMGTFRLDAYGKIALERPQHDEGCFTFYASDTEEYAKASGGSVAKDLRGLVTVVFKPERQRSYVNRPIARVALGGLPEDAYDRQGSATYNMSKSRSADADMEVGGAPEREEKTSGGIRTPDTKLLSRGAGGAHSLTRGAGGQSQMRAGVTGLSGHSNQRFVEVPPLDYDPTEEVTVNIRLVAWDDGPRPLTGASSKTNPVPAAVE